jgi:hypothetical protein
MFQGWSRAKWARRQAATFTGTQRGQRRSPVLKASSLPASDPPFLRRSSEPDRVFPVRLAGRAVRSALAWQAAVCGQTRRHGRSAVWSPWRARTVPAVCRRSYRAVGARDSLTSGQECGARGRGLGIAGQAVRLSAEHGRPEVRLMSGAVVSADSYAEAEPGDKGSGAGAEAGRSHAAGVMSASLICCSGTVGSCPGSPKGCNCNEIAAGISLFMRLKKKPTIQR